MSDAHTTLQAPLFGGLLHDAATRCARELLANPDAAGAATPLDLIATMGWPALLLDEADGGAGGTLADLAAIIEPLAAAAVHLPVVEACAIAPILLAADPSRPAGAQLLPALAEAGARVMPLIDPCAGLDEPPLTASPHAQGVQLDGRVQGVPHAQTPSHWVAVARLASGAPALYLVPGDALRPLGHHRTLDGATTADFELRGLVLGEDACVAVGEPARAALARAELAALLATCVDLACASTALVEQTIEYLKNRRQFDATLSSFQVLRHRVVDMYVKSRGARGLIEQYLREPGADLADARRRLRLMKLSLGEVGRFCAEQAIQSHGAMGLSEEVLATRLAQRLIQCDYRHGDRYACLHQLEAIDAGRAQDWPGGALPRIFSAVQTG